jgi:hypothetical protein
MSTKPGLVEFNPPAQFIIYHSIILEALLTHPDVPYGHFCQEASWDDIEVDSLLQAVMLAKNRAPTCKKGSGDMHLHAVTY